MKELYYAFSNLKKLILDLNNSDLEREIIALFEKHFVWQIKRTKLLEHTK